MLREGPLSLIRAINEGFPQEGAFELSLQRWVEFLPGSREEKRAGVSNGGVDSQKAKSSSPNYKARGNLLVYTVGALQSSPPA